VPDDNSDTKKEFDDAVNMTASELEKWLDTDESKSVGQKSGGSGESTGGYTKRHLAQRPSGDVEKTAWRYSLMNWGHDPVKRKS
jgi:hypothetical protein